MTNFDSLSDSIFVTFGNYWDGLGKSFNDTDKKTIAELIICALSFELNNDGYKYEKILDTVLNGLKTYHQIEAKNAKSGLEELRNKILKDRITISFGKNKKL